MHLRRSALDRESFVELPQDFLVRAGIHSINTFGALFLVVVCGNVALLMFARAATREREILVRRALGAARSRIVMQLFAEALVLAAIAAVLGRSVFAGRAPGRVVFEWVGCGLV